ncbi:deoxyribonuclease IV [Paenibacillus sp. NPDC058174]|uniref:deoxyribonuclease IV n=1 Tax=Paenibacillus sp. NPDC058174 TaxID=3346366 RepID=UPI0036DCA932
MVRVGRHLSIRGGYAAAAKEAYSGGMQCFQYFPKNPRSLTIKRFDRNDAARCADFCREHDLKSIAHTPYPTNLAAEGETARQRVVESLLNDLDIADTCGSVGVVVHFGIYKGSEPLQGYQSIIYTLNEVTSRWDRRAKLLIEIQSGEHAFMGTTFEELAQIRKLCQRPEQLAYCLDTCHMFASGMWQGAGDEKWLAAGERLEVLGDVAAVHFNDSLFPSGSRRDRHAPVGKGYIGEEAMKWMLTLPQLEDVPFVLETPPDEDGSYERQLNLMREWGSQS